MEKLQLLVGIVLLAFLFSWHNAIIGISNSKLNSFKVLESKYSEVVNERDNK